jgi:pre-mRNA-processing factor 19
VLCVIETNLSFCISVSNEVPEVAVVSPSSGAIFEKRIVEKYIIENGVDPINGKELRIEDLIEIKSKYKLIITRRK